MVQSAMDGVHSLSPAAQDKLLRFYLNDGYGPFANGIARQLKCPGRFGLKLVDTALIMTIYTRTYGLYDPKPLAPISMDDFKSDTAMDEKNIRKALADLSERGVFIKIETGHGKINFWGLNPYYFSIKSNGKTNGKISGKKKGKQPRGKVIKQLEIKRKFPTLKLFLKTFLKTLLSERVIFRRTC